jgi:hypothetical protein
MGLQELELDRGKGLQCQTEEQWESLRGLWTETTSPENHRPRCLGRVQKVLGVSEGLKSEKNFPRTLPVEQR